jgi:Tol biopolymer transport system component
LIARHNHSLAQDYEYKIKDSQVDLAKECQIERIDELFGPVRGGFALSPVDDNLVAYSRPDHNTVFQVFLRKLDNNTETCLTCSQNSEGPPVGLHKGAPYFHPNGQYIILQVEMAEHPFKGKLGTPGPGWFNNLWIITIDSGRWAQLTNYPHGPKDRYGVLIPRISANGNRVVWAQLYKGPKPWVSLMYKRGKVKSGGNPWGYWKLNFADLIIHSKGVRLENIVSLRPGSGNFYETQDWSPNGQSILFSSDINRDSPHKGDIYRFDVTGKKITALTDTDDAWEEFATFSPDGKKIAYMSSACCNWIPSSPKHQLMTELYIMDADGSRKVQLTHFNTPGYPESTQGRNIVGKAYWTSDGRKLIFAHHNLKKRASNLWALTFAGACGKAE